MHEPFNAEAFWKFPVVGIMRGLTIAHALRASAAAAEGGLRYVEVTMNTPDAAGQIRQLRADAAGRLTIGAGTVCNLRDLELAIDAGAEFIVTPVVVPEVIRACVALGMPIFPGALSPTEIFTAWDLGATAVKVFPAEAIGPTYLAAVKAPLPHIRLMPTGGITPETLPVYRKNGADAFGVGSPLFDKSRIAAGDWTWITTQTRRFVKAFAE